MFRVNVLGGLYVTDAGRTASGAAAQPRRLALLALLAVARDRGMTRDALVAYLWPDHDEERGRRALTQAVYALRRDLGSDDVLPGLKDLRLNPELITSDFEAFTVALARGDLDAAVEEYRGPFLDGFNLPGSDTFERWMEEQRGALTHDYQDLLGRLADRSRAAGDHRGAIGWFRKLAALDPLNARVAISLMSSLAESGDLAGALQHARVYEALVRQELDLPPDRQVVELAERLRRSPGSVISPTPAEGSARPVRYPLASRAPTQPAPVESTGGPASAEPPPAVPAVPPPGPAESIPMASLPGPTPPVEVTPRELAHTSGWAIQRQGPSQPRRSRSEVLFRVRRFPILAFATVAIVAVVGAALFRSARRPGPSVDSSRRVVAVGQIAHYPRQGGGTLGQPLADMLATNLARVEELRVISHVRMVEVQRQLGGRDSGAAGAVAARQAGATELIDGSLYEIADGEYRLDLRRVDLSTGAVLKAYTCRGTELFALADSGTSELVRDLGGEAPEIPLAEVSTRSLEAYRAYEAGLRKWFTGDRSAAEQLFAEALRADSSFAMAAYYYANSELFGDRHETFRRMRRAVTLASRASDRERLLILAAWAYVNSSPRITAYADTLIVRYPAELEGYFYRGQGGIMSGDFARAREALHRVVALDTLGYSRQAARCLPCEALQALTVSYSSVDSQAYGNRFLRIWTDRQPFSALAWRTFAVGWLFAGPYADSAEAAWRRADSLEPGSPANRQILGYLRFREERYAEAEQIYRVESQAGLVEHQIAARWQLANLLRSMGRRREALEEIRSFRQVLERRAGAAGTQYSRILEAQILWENGQGKAAVALFDSLAHDLPPGADQAYLARHRTWLWAHMSGVLASIGDTTTLRWVADSMAALGQVSGLWRDWRLHHHARGLLALARRDTSEAARQFALAISSPNFGFGRTNYELAGALLSLGRPLEAVATLQAALRGAIDGGNLYITRTELHERIARAWEATGRPDSAAAHYALVARHWEHADADFISRRDEASARAAKLGRPVTAPTR